MRRSWILTLPPILEEAYAAQIVIQEYETFRSRTYEYDRHRDRLGKELREALDAAAAITADAYDAARRTRAAHAKCLPTPWPITT